MQGFDRKKLIEMAVQMDAVVEIVPAIGDFVPKGSELLRVHGGKESDLDPLFEEITLGKERTMNQDPAFGFRQLVDIAEKGLSPSVNDPTTAVQCLDEIHDLLRMLADRPFPTGQWRDDEGNLRLVSPVRSWDAYIHLAFDEIRHYGNDSLQIHRRMRAILLDLLDVAPADRHEPLRLQLRLLDAVAERDIPDEEDRVTSRIADRQGLGGS